MSLNAITCENLTCERGGRLIFRALSLRASAGSFVTFEGANGVGKTSLLRVLAGLLPPLGGEVRFATGAGEITDGEERGGYVGWFGHQDGIKAQLSVLENAHFFAALYGGKSDVREAMERTGIAKLAGLPAQYLSAGQRRRLALARLLLSRRPLWLLDEPLAALDSAGKALVADLIAAHVKAGGIAMAATHDPIGVAGEKLVLGAFA